MSHPPLVLSLFPGWADLLGRGFSEEGFSIVRGPDIIWGSDIRNFHVPPRRFDGVIGGPPCQRFSTVRRISESRGACVPAVDLIPEFARIVAEARPNWFLMENVRAAYAPEVAPYRIIEFVLDCRVFGVPQKQRVRRFVFGARLRRTVERMLPFRVPLPQERDVRYTALASEGRRGRLQWKNGHKVTRHCATRPWPEFCRLQGLPPGYDLVGLTKIGKYDAVGNGVPLPAARAFARAIMEAAHQPPQPQEKTA